jgi:hypothetical protein
VSFHPLYVVTERVAVILIQRDGLHLVWAAR